MLLPGEAPGDTTEEGLVEYETICTAPGCGIDTADADYGYVWDGGAACDAECLEAQA